MLNLLYLFFIPLIGSALIFSLPRLSAQKLKYGSLAISLIPLILLLLQQTGTVFLDWVPQLSIAFFLKVDFLSLLFLYLTAVIIPITIVIKSNPPYPNLFFGFILLLEGLLIGFFTARDLVVFTLFWEAMLLPLYFIITLWGGERRKEAGLQFLIYMIAGSFLLIASLLGIYFLAGTFNLERLAGHHYPEWIGAIFLLAFAVKTPLFPFHAWLPFAYVEAPTSGTILLSALLSKAGIYGIARVGLGLFPNFIIDWSSLLLGLAIAGVFYGGFCAWSEHNYKRLIAYSSFSHVNFILIGLFTWHVAGHSGAIIQAFNHGITITALFLVASWLQKKIGTFEIYSAKGLTHYFPNLAWLTLFFILSSVALPGLNNFIGEFLILFGLWNQNIWLTVILSLSVVLSVIYMLRWMQNVYFGPPSKLNTSSLDIGMKEFAIVTPLILLILWFGIYPGPILKQLEIELTTKVEYELE